MVETVRSVMDRLEARRQEEIEIPPDGLSLELLRAVYRANHLPLVTRIRAAAMCLKHEFPSLGVSINVNETEDFAQRLDRAIYRANLAKAIEHQPTNGSDVSNGQSEVIGTELKPIERAPLSRIYSNRFRRRL